MSSITLKVSDLIDQVNNKLKEEKQTFINANLERVDALLKAIELGELYIKLYDMFRNSPNIGTVTTDLGTYKGWADFLKQNGYNYNTVSSYIFMYQHQQEFAELKLISKDPTDLASGAAGHRKIAAIKAVKWYLQKIAAEGEQIRGTLTACDYQRYIQSKAKANVDEEAKGTDYKKMYNELSARYSLLELEIDNLRSKLEEYKQQEYLNML